MKEHEADGAEDMTHQFVAYVEKGFALVPIPLGSKGPSRNGWNERENAITEPDKAALLTGNAGLAHAYCTPTPTATLDIDHMQLARSWLSDRGVDLDSLLDADDAVQIRSGKPNRGKLVYALPVGMAPLQTHKIHDPVKKCTVLEFRCATANGKTVQDVLPPSIHPETGRPYEWAGNGDWRNLPTLPQCLLDIWPKGRSTPESHINPNAQTAAVMVDEQTVQHLRSALLHMRADDRDLWIKVGMALHCLGEVGRGLWLEWSLISEKGHELEVAQTWETFKPDTINYRYVFAEAQRQGWVNPTKNYSRANSQAGDGWPIPQPLPSELLPVRTLDPSWLPATIQDAVIDITERLGCPMDYVAIPILVGAGTVLGNTVGILPKEHDTSWEVYPGFWGGIVGNPGSMKTPALNAAFKPLYHLEEQAANSYKALLGQYHADLKIYEKALADHRSGKSKTPPIEPIEPVRKRLIVNDVTYQKLGEILQSNPSGVLALADELSGLLQSLDTPGQEAARGFYLSGWGGSGNYTFDRIARGTVSLSNYMLSVFGGFQPDRLKTYVKGTQTGNSQNDGLLQRFQLLAWPDTDPTFAFIDRPPNQAAIDKMHAAILRLKSLRDQRIGGAVRNSRGASLLHFTPDGQAFFNKWYVANETVLRSGSLTSALHSHFSKYRSLLPGLALLFHLLEGHQDAVCEDCLASSLRLAKYLKSHAHRVYASVGGLDNAAIRALARQLIDGKLTSGFTARSVYTKGWSALDKPESVKAALDALVEFGWLREVMLETGGRKTVSYEINPALKKGLL